MIDFRIIWSNDHAIEIKAKTGSFYYQFQEKTKEKLGVK